MWRQKLANTGAIELQDVDHVQYVKSHMWRRARRSCPIDVVTERFFPKLLQQIEIDCKRTLGRMEKRADEIVNLR